MHPVVIMAYDKSPAITKAVAALEEAGMEVRVLNTGHAKLADFLGALAGEDDEDEVPADEPKEEKPKTDEEPPADDVPAEEPPADEGTGPEITESLKALVDGEEIVVQLTEGESELYPTGLMVGKKTAYALNESHFAFWPVQLEEGLYDLMHDVQVQFGDKAVYERVKIQQPGDWALLKLNKDTYAKFQEAK